jgi:hypothetical protein
VWSDNADGQCHDNRALCPCARAKTCGLNDHETRAEIADPARAARAEGCAAQRRVCTFQPRYATDWPNQQTLAGGRAVDGLHLCSGVDSDSDSV